MSNEQEKVSRAFLKSVLQAEAEDLEEPAAIAEPEADRRLAEQLANKYAIAPKARAWFLRPQLLGALGLGAAAAAALWILRPVDTDTAPLLTHQVSTSAIGESQTLGNVVSGTTSRRLSPNQGLRVSLQSPVVVQSERSMAAFIGDRNRLLSLPAVVDVAGSSYTFIVSQEALAKLPRGLTTAYLLICKKGRLPSESRLLEQIRALPSTNPSSRETTAILSGVCQLAPTPLELVAQQQTP